MNDILEKNIDFFEELKNQKCYKELTKKRGIYKIGDLITCSYAACINIRKVKIYLNHDNISLADYLNNFLRKLDPRLHLGMSYDELYNLTLDGKDNQIKTTILDNKLYLSDLRAAITNNLGYENVFTVEELLRFFAGRENAMHSGINGVATTGIIEIKNYIKNLDSKLYFGMTNKEIDDYLIETLGEEQFNRRAKIKNAIKDKGAKINDFLLDTTVDYKKFFPLQIKYHNSKTYLGEIIALIYKCKCNNQTIENEDELKKIIESINIPGLYYGMSKYEYMVLPIINLEYDNSKLLDETLKNNEDYKKVSNCIGYLKMFDSDVPIKFGLHSVIRNIIKRDYRNITLLDILLFYSEDKEALTNLQESSNFNDMNDFLHTIDSKLYIGMPTSEIYSYIVEEYEHIKKYKQIKNNDSYYNNIGAVEAENISLSEQIKEREEKIKTLEDLIAEQEELIKKRDKLDEEILALQLKLNANIKKL